MSHTVVAKLNKAARQHTNNSGVTFFVDLGERNYNFQTKQNEYTNYSAALFAKDGQIQFYADSLIEGAVIEVSGTGIILEMPNDPQYRPKLMIQDAKLGFINSPMQQGQQQSAPQQAPAYQQQAPQPAPQQQAPQMAPAYQPQMAPAYQPQQAPQQSQTANQFFDPNTQAPQPQNYNGG